MLIAPPLRRFCGTSDTSLQACFCQREGHALSTVVCLPGSKRCSGQQVLSCAEHAGGALAWPALGGVTSLLACQCASDPARRLTNNELTLLYVPELHAFVPCPQADWKVPQLPHAWWGWPDHCPLCSETTSLKGLNVGAVGPQQQLHRQQPYHLPGLLDGRGPGSAA